MRPVSFPDLRAHTFFSSTKSALNVGEAEKKIHRKPRAYVQTRRTRSCENRAVSVFDANRTGKREKRCEHLQFTHHFCLSKIFFCFLLACEKCEESEKREARERERERDEKSKKLGFLIKKNLKTLSLFPEREPEREREREASQF